MYHTVHALNLTFQLKKITSTWLHARDVWDIWTIYTGPNADISAREIICIKTCVSFSSTYGHDRQFPRMKSAINFERICTHISCFENYKILKWRFSHRTNECAQSGNNYFKEGKGKINEKKDCENENCSTRTHLYLSPSPAPALLHVVITW